MRRTAPTLRQNKHQRSAVRVLMLVENCGYPDDMRILMESRSLRDAGYRVSVICPKRRSYAYYEELDGVFVYRYPQLPELKGFVGYVVEYAYSLIVTWLVSLWILLRTGFDVLHVRVPPDVYVAIAWPYKLLGKYFVVDLQDSSPDLYAAKLHGRGNGTVHGILSRLERFSCRASDCLITINESYRRMLAERTGLDPNSCHVVRNAPDPRFLLPWDPLPDLRVPGRTVVGYMGIIGEQDRVDLFLEALRLLRMDRGRTDFMGLVIGSGPALSSVKSICSQMGLDDAVRFVGYLQGEALFRHMATLDIGVTPDPSNPYSDYCSFLKTMEYMATAKPVVCFDLPESRTSAGDAALYAMPNDIADLARQIERLMDDPPLRERLGAIGRARAENELSWERQEAALLRAYDGMLNPLCTSVEPRPVERSSVGI